MKLANHRGRAVLVVEDAIVGDEGDVGAADMGAVDIARAELHAEHAEVVAIVVNRGRYFVDGWVQTPGAYEISPGTTAFGALSAAGARARVAALLDDLGFDPVEFPADASGHLQGDGPVFGRWVDAKGLRAAIERAQAV